MSYTINDFEMMTPMRYYNNEDQNNAKRQAMIENEDNQYIATKKLDGDFSMLIHYEKGKNLIRSRNLSKVTGKYGNHTEKLPHIVAEMDLLPDNTVLLAEICWDEPGSNNNAVGTILRCLAPKAIERQKDKKLKAVVFDCLMIEGRDLTDQGYEYRLKEAYNLCVDDSFATADNLAPLSSAEYIYMTEIFYDNFIEEATRIIDAGGEGLVIQRKDYTYNPGSRTAWKTLKLKQSLEEMELLVIDTIEPKKDYQGIEEQTWPYWALFDENGNVIEWSQANMSDHSWKPVTKPFFNGWKNGVTVLFEGVKTDITSGLTDADREWLATPEAAQMIANQELYAVVKAMSINDKGALRHGYLVRLRNDL